MGMLISVDGEQKEVNPVGDTFSLQELQQYVKGLIEIVPIDDKRMAVVNEEGLLMQLPMNSVASQVAGRLLLGPVLVLSSDEIQ
jgi:hypothetical protein